MQRAFAKLADGKEGDLQQLLAAVRSGDDAPAGARRHSEALHAAAARDRRACSRASSVREGRRALRLLDHPRFRAAYDFLLLRAAAGEIDAGAGAMVDGHSIGLGRRAHRARGKPGTGPRTRAVARPAPPSSPPPTQTARRIVSDGASGCRRTSRSAAISTIRRDRSQPLSSDSRLPTAAGSSRVRACTDPRRSGRRISRNSSMPSAGLLTVLAPRELLRALKRIEAELGRAQPVVRWGPRRIDLDLLLLDDVRIDGAGSHDAASRPDPAQLRPVSFARYRARAARSRSRDASRPGGARGVRRPRAS